MFSAILKKLASDNAENLAMSNRIEYYVMIMRNIALAISEKNEDALTEAIKLLDSLGVVDLHKHGC
ncbi:hypothetical protein BTHERMOSOX_116 [Bathymodiolus thermophilus thioautotrophic gill symbiont]|nr:hypothetical protein BTHERMOSOX_116 [Bathymodiolus thermophilus thioautotrophic gill symbiont]